VPPSLPLSTVVARLAAAGCVAADDEAAELIASAPDDEVLHDWIARREQGEPLAWITGTVEFCGHLVHVDSGVYVPRPQSEDLARRAADVVPPDGRAIDVCTGSGAIAVHLMAAAPTATVVGVDRDPVAARCARRNGVSALVADLADAVRTRAFDVATAVAPYVPTAALRLLPADVQRYEPRVALDGGGDGLDVVRGVVAAAARVLRPGGWLLLEVGGDQDRGVRPVLAQHGFGDPSFWTDDDGDLRGVAAQLPTA
jgi:release factor glutamine methyltransferase